MADSEKRSSKPTFLTQDLASIPAPSGTYTLKRLLSRGISSDVFLAHHPYQNLVAIKILRPGFVNPKRIQRFHEERAILAGLDHPYVAGFIDQGTTPEGQPFLVMEYVDGQHITQYCSGAKLSFEKLVDLFLKICSAVSAAHQNLIVHRDLKPENILVTGDGTPKLLDFGIAELLGEGSGMSSYGTKANGILMTPEYASPEQILGQEISTSCDIYALGVLFFELVTGRGPYLFASKSLAAIKRTVLESDPPRPSKLLKPDSPWFKKMRGFSVELDAVLLKALRKNPTARYLSVDALTEDLDRLTNGRPVLAQRGTALYAFKKFFLRNRWNLSWLLPAGLTCLFLPALIGLQGDQQIAHFKLTRSRVLEEQNVLQQDVRDLVSLFNPEMLPVGSQDADMAALFGSQDFADSVTKGLGLEEQIRVQVLLGKLLLKMDNPKQALTRFEAASSLMAVKFGSNEGTSGGLNNLLGRAHQQLGSSKTAESHFLKAIMPGPGFGAGPQEITGYLNLSNLYALGNRILEQEIMLRKALELQRNYYGTLHFKTAETLQKLAQVQVKRKQYPLAVATQREAVTALSQTLGKVHPWTLDANAQLDHLEKSLHPKVVDKGY